MKYRWRMICKIHPVRHIAFFSRTPTRKELLRTGPIEDYHVELKKAGRTYDILPAKLSVTNHFSIRTSAIISFPLLLNLDTFLITASFPNNAVAMFSFVQLAKSSILIVLV